MRSDPPSTGKVAWIVGALSERDELAGLLADGPGDPRDELGIAPLRDLMADAFFPGITTQQTRAKYFLFVPAMYMRIERDRALSKDPAASAEMLEAELLSGLLWTHADSDETGIIGSRRRRVPARPPAAIYWNGLRRWRLRLCSGSRELFHRRLRGTSPVELLEEGVEAQRRNWAIGELGPELLDGPSLLLSADERTVLRDAVDRLEPRPHVPLLTHLLDEEVRGTEHLWQTVAAQRLDEPISDLARHAELLASALEGAMLLYNRDVAKEHGQPPAVDDFATRLDEWRSGHDADQWGVWDIADLWRLTTELGGGRLVPRGLRTFLDDWLTELRRPGPLDDARASALIARRERQHKVGRHRLGPGGTRQNWTATGVGLGLLQYRWPQARRMLADLSD